ncbi:1-aminocyclopropane-1-carboxylate deaminase [Caballeronia sordidicola]|nr:1-aminocyclopropane-1-carboxylate deaminase [Caballeronia sordidicola]
MNLDHFQRMSFTFGASPLEPLPRLSARLGGKVEIWAKRDDCNSGIAFGGNKTRKLEYMVPDAISTGCDTLVSIGGIQSNHTRQVAGVAAKAGLKCHLVHGSWVNWPDGLYDRVGNIQLSKIMGAHCTFSKEPFGIEFKKSWRVALEEVEELGGKPYAIPAGASDHPLGGLGYVRFAKELRQQERELGFTFDYIVVGSGTGSTQAGMIVGFKEDDRAQSVIGIDLIGLPDDTFRAIKKIAAQTAEMLNLGSPILDEDIVLKHGYAGPQYGIPSDATIEAIHVAGSLEGMITDPVYEGKSMHGLIDLVNKDYFETGSKVLYVHLGGAPALNGYSYAFR